MLERKFKALPRGQLPMGAIFGGYTVTMCGSAKWCKRLRRRKHCYCGKDPSWACASNKQECYHCRLSPAGICRFIVGSRWSAIAIINGQFFDVRICLKSSHKARILRFESSTKKGTNYETHVIKCARFCRSITWSRWEIGSGADDHGRSVVSKINLHKCGEALMELHRSFTCSALVTGMNPDPA